MLFTKQVGDHLGLLLAPVQMAAHDGHEFGSVGRLLPSPFVLTSWFNNSSGLSSGQ